MIASSPDLKASLTNLVGVVGVAFIVLIGLGLIARLLDPSDFGLFMLFVSLTALGKVACFGLDRVIARLAALHKIDDYTDADLDWTIGACIIASVLTALVLAFVVLLLKEVINYSDDIYVAVLLGLIGLVPNSIFLASVSLLEGRGYFARAATERIKFNAASFLGALFLVSLTPTAVSAMAGMLAGRALYCFSTTPAETFPRVLRTFRDHGRPNQKNIRVIKEGAPITGSAALGWLMINGDRWLVSSFMGLSSVGYYSTMSDLIFRLGLIPGAVSTALFPRIVKEASRPSGAHGPPALLLVAATAYVPVYFLSDHIVQIWLGRDYVSSIPILEIMSIGAFFLSIANYPLMKLQALRRNGIVLASHCVQCCLFLGAVGFFAESGDLEMVAWCFSVRCFVDMVILFYIAHAVVPPRG